MGKYGKGIFAEQRSSNAEGEFKEQKTEMLSEKKQCMQSQLFSSKSKIKNPLTTKQSQKKLLFVFPRFLTDVTIQEVTLEDTGQI